MIKFQLICYNFLKYHIHRHQRRSRIVRSFIHTFVSWNSMRKDM